jgi:hypothetical protein
MPVNLDRMFENALDWEHLPALHSSSFRSVELIGYRFGSIGDPIHPRPRRQGRARRPPR